ncbi:unnamed protein product [Acanthoscelides obtectus]|uniref:Uncharacterized protein n=1 Tax=Acanthoscelides obtectus TaxID=200917 RepID=A0A9P0KH27_ACAOB|nr:unnamed protein product [Acanthoscelides obtectus]CAK1640012.1 hypothetical protein AOBTE_LOCUS11506 [Acanthoscelides obtectus]
MFKDDTFQWRLAYLTEIFNSLTYGKLHQLMRA